MPSRFADNTEMEALVGTLGEVGAGCFMLTKGTPSDTSFGRIPSLPGEPY